MTVSVNLKVDKRLAVASLGVVAIILYGSLFPFHFVDRAMAGGPLRALLATPLLSGDNSDNLSNFLLYIPLGIVTMRALRTWPRALVAPLVILAGCALSACIEMAQFYDPGRLGELTDVLTNTAGTIAGVVIALCLKRELTRPFSVLLLACWLGNRLFPYLPHLDFHVHMTLRVPSMLEVYKQATYWLAAAVILEAIFDAARSRIVLATMVGIVLIVRLLVVALTISTAEVGGALIAVIAWMLLSRIARRVEVVTILFAALVILQALDPFHFLTVPRQFEWVPFTGFITTSRENGIHVFFEKAFTYGCVVWLPVRAGASLPIATIAGAAIVFALRLAQVYLPGRSAESTDAVMVLLFGGLMYLLREPRS